MRSLKELQEVLDRYGVNYTIGTPEESAASMAILDSAINKFLYGGDLIVSHVKYEASDPSPLYRCDRDGDRLVLLGDAA